MALVFELASPLATASTVTSCDDTSAAATTAGTLRYEVAHAASGDTINFNLPPSCNSTVSLKTGAVTISQDDLTITGAGAPVTIEKYQGAYQGAPTAGRVLAHQGAGTLHLDYLTIRYGSLQQQQKKVYGGCVYSKGSVSLYRSSVDKCFLSAYGVDMQSASLAAGAGIFAAKNVSLSFSSITRNTADGISTVAGNAYASCAGVDAQGVFQAVNSTISGNETVTPFGVGGGACVYGGATISQSTISGNKVGTGGAHFVFYAMGGGGLFASVGGSLTIASSTISGNVSDSFAGGVLSYLPTTVTNSTIAFNTAKSGYNVHDQTAAAGLSLQGGSETHAVYGSILADNIAGAVGSDLSIHYSTLNGGHDLIQQTVQSGIVPADTITGRCPLLLPLRDNGGPTWTHALMVASPALDKGVLLAPTPTDQRGLPRESPPGFPDIGAYEVQPDDDVLLVAGFEDCH